MQSDKQRSETIRIPTRQRNGACGFLDQIWASACLISFIHSFKSEYECMVDCIWNHKKKRLSRPLDNRPVVPADNKYGPCFVAHSRECADIDWFATAPRESEARTRRSRRNRSLNATKRDMDRIWLDLLAIAGSGILTGHFPLQPN